jgi:carbamoyltransferase
VRSHQEKSTDNQGDRRIPHRSILADPRPAENKTRINEMVKKREGYRPFAPSVLEEYLPEVVELPAARADLSFMTFTLNVRQRYRSLLGAVTHVDGSARVQSVSRARDPLYWQLIDAFRVLTGVPALLNTSFNNNAEPIADSVFDIVTCFLTIGIDAVVIGDVLVRRCDGIDLPNALRRLRAVLPTSRKLVARRRVNDDAKPYTFTLEATASRHFVTQHLPITADQHRILLHADGHSTLDELFERCNINSADSQRLLLKEIQTLWDHRAVVLRP